MKLLSKTLNWISNSLFDKYTEKLASRTTHLLKEIKLIFQDFLNFRRNILNLIDT